MSIGAKKIKMMLAWVFAFALCFTLVGCGDSGSSPASSASGTENASASGSESSSESVPEDPAAKFVGDWKVGAVETQNVLVVGDFSQAYEEATNMVLTLKEDGTGSMGLGEESTDLKWELVDDTSLSLTIETSDEPLVAKYDDGALVVAIEDQGTMHFTKEGADPLAPVFSVADGTAVTSADEVAGTWTLAGAGMSGMMLYGDEADLASLGVGSLEDDGSKLILNADTTAKALGDDTTWSVNENGAFVNVSFFGESVDVPMVKYEDYLLLDVTEGMGADMFFIFKK